MNYLKRSHRVVVAASLVGVLASCGQDSRDKVAAVECGPISVAFPTSSEAKLVTYAVTNGKVEVKSKGLKLEVHYLEVPALIQATGSDQFDLLQTSLVGFAGAIDKGAPLVGVAPVASRGPGQDKIVVKNDSPIRAITDLKGTTMAVGSIGSTVTTLMRMGLAKDSGLNLRTQGGDVKFVEMPANVALIGVQRGNVGSAFVYQQPWWKIQSDKNYRELGDVQEIFAKVYGFRPMISMMVTTKNIDSKKHACLIAASDTLLASWEYARANPDEVANALTASESVAAADLKALITSGYEYGGSRDAALIERAQRTLQAIREAGEMKVEVPNLKQHMIGS